MLVLFLHYTHYNLQSAILQSRLINMSKMYIRALRNSVVFVTLECFSMQLRPKIDNKV